MFLFNDCISNTTQPASNDVVIILCDTMAWPTLKQRYTTLKFFSLSFHLTWEAGGELSDSSK